GDGEEVLFPQIYVATTGRFRAVSIAPVTEGATPIAAGASLPPVAGEAPLGLFRFAAASSQAGDGGRADALRTPRELEDGRVETAWRAGMGGWGRGAGVAARARAGGRGGGGGGGRVAGGGGCGAGGREGGG